MPTARDAFRWLSLRQPARYAVLLALLYAYVLWVLGPRLLFHDQSPAFFWRWAAFSQYAKSWPGGLTEYLGAGLSQTYAYPWLGALVLALAVGSVCLFTELLSGRIARTRASRSAPPLRRSPWTNLLPFLPALCLLPLLNRYGLPLSAIIALYWALLFGYVFACLSWRRAVPRLVMAGVMCCVVYVLAGGVSVLFAFLCGLAEIMGRRSWLSGAIVILAGAGLPYVAGSQLYWIGQQDAFLRLATFDYDVSPPLASIALYVSFPLVLLIIAGWPALRVRSSRQQDGPPSPERGRRNSAKESLSLAGSQSSDGCPRLVEGSLGWCLRTAVLVLAGALIAYASFDANRQAVLAIDYHTRNREWDKALQAARRFEWAGAVPGRRKDEEMARTCFTFRFPVAVHAGVPLLTSYGAAIHDINFALAQRGQLLDDMFRYPQPMGMSVVRLQPDSMGAYVAHSYNTDCLLDLGHLNEAERVACESLANIGPRPWLLERLVIINVLKQRVETARACLAVLASDLRHRAWAEALRRELQADPSLSKRQDLQRVRSRMYRKDYVGNLPNMNPDEEMLRYLLVANPHNRMAFDYLMAHYLLTLRDDQVVRNVRYLKEFGYTRVPRHCEEAVLLHARLAEHAPDLHGFRVSPETIRRFEAFQRDLDHLGGPGGPDKTRVRDQLLAQYGDTYWFYALFGNSFFGDARPASTSRPGEGS